MAKGRRPTPTAVKRLKGNPGKRRLNKNEPKPARAKLDPPRRLTTVARAAWKEIISEVDRLGMATVLDRHTLEQYCVALATVIKAQWHIQREGAVIETERGSRANPWCAIEKDNRKTMLDIAREFGFTPAARSKISITPAKPDGQSSTPTLADMQNNQPGVVGKIGKSA